MHTLHPQHLQQVAGGGDQDTIRIVKPQNPPPTDTVRLPEVIIIDKK
ncbi:hypothetical protein [Lysobacter sp. Root604]|nr:hypothetical protein [Lysobacter sp. Root604]